MLDFCKSCEKNELLRFLAIEGENMKTIILLFVLLGLAACDGGSGGGGLVGGEGGPIPGSELPQLTGEQKTRIMNVSTEMQDIETVTSSPGVTKTTLLREVKEEGRLSEKGQKFQKTMEDAVDFGRCQVTGIPDPADPNYDPMNPNYEIRIVSAPNERCPIYYVTAFSTKQEQQSEQVFVVKSNQDMEFTVDPVLEVYRELDIKSYKMSSNMDVISTMLSETSAKVAGTGDAKGAVESKKEGTISYSMGLKMLVNYNFDKNTKSITGDMMNNITMTVSFKDFKAVGYIQMSGNFSGEQTEPESKYFINGSEVTEKEFSEIFNMDMVLTDEADATGME